MSIILPVLLLFIFIAVGIPVAVGLAAAGGIGLLLNVPVDSFLGIYQNTPYRSTAKFLLSALPMFILMAEFLSRAHLTNSIFEVCALITKKIAGGLGIATVIAGAILGALSGSSTASTATLSRVAVPQMLRRGYSQEMSLGIVSVSGTLAIMIPPSIALIIYGMMAEVSIGTLLIAGLIPGLTTAVLYALVIFFWYKRDEKKKQKQMSEAEINKIETEMAATKETNEKKSEEELTLGQHLIKTTPVFLLIFIIVGGLYSGIFTATEAASIGAVAALLIGMIAGKLDVTGIIASLKQAVLTTTMIFTIIIGASIFGYFMTFSNATHQFVEMLTTLDVSRWIILIIILLVFLLLGFFMDQLAILLLLVPMVIPVVKELDFNLIWFGILIVKTVEIGLCTPPLGLNVFVSSSTTKLPVEKAFKGTSVMLIADIAFVILLLLFPVIALWLPTQMGG